MKKQLFLALMTLISLGSLQAADDIAGLTKLTQATIVAGIATAAVPPLGIIAGVVAPPFISLGILQSIANGEFEERFRQYPVLTSILLGSNLLYYYGCNPKANVPLGPIIPGLFCTITALVADSMPRGALRPPFQPNHPAQLNNDADEGLGAELL